MISSRQALSQVEQAILGVRRDEDRLTAMLRSATEETARLRARQAEAYKALARLRLDDLQANKVTGELDAAERDALAAIEKGKAALAEIAAKRAVLVETIASGEKTLDERSDRLEKAIDAIDALTEKTRARLAGEAAWLAARDKVKDTEAKAAAALEKADQADKDLAEKRKPYDADPLFSYLWQRGYGTSAYRAGFIARYFDGKVAKLVGYDKARPNYYMLTEIPVRLRDHAARLNEAIATAKSALVALERRALEADGVARLEAAAAAADDERTAFAAGLEGAKAELAALDKEQAALLDPSGSLSLAKSIEGLAAALVRIDLATLHQQALKTPTPEDERIVATLREIEPALRRREARRRRCGRPRSSWRGSGRSSRPHARIFTARAMTTRAASSRTAPTSAASSAACSAGCCRRGTSTTPSGAAGRRRRAARAARPSAAGSVSPVARPGRGLRRRRAPPGPRPRRGHRPLHGRAAGSGPAAGSEVRPEAYDRSSPLGKSNTRSPGPPRGSCAFTSPSGPSTAVGPHAAQPGRSPVTSAEISQSPVSRHRAPRAALCRSLNRSALSNGSMLLAGQTMSAAPRSATRRAASGKFVS
jgi:hypothetical protein